MSDLITQRKNINVLSPNPETKTYKALVRAVDHCHAGHGEEVVKNLFQELEESDLPFEDFDEMKNRVKGIGEKTIEGLKKIGYTVEDVSKLDDSSLVSIEQPIEDIWKGTNKQDKYTGKKKYVKAESEADHVVDGAITDLAWKEAMTEVGSVKETRQHNVLKDAVRDLLGNFENLNVTEKEIKIIKNSPFKNYAEKRERGVSGLRGFDATEYMEKNHKDFIDSGNWERTKVAVVDAYDVAKKNKIFEGKLKGKTIGGIAEKIAEKVGENLEDSMQQLKLG